jgi:hypothetical protein
MSAGAFPDILRRVNFDRRRGAIVMGGSGGRTELFPIGSAFSLRSLRPCCTSHATPSISAAYSYGLTAPYK